MQKITVSVPVLIEVADDYFYANRIDEAIEKYLSIIAMAPDLGAVDMFLGHAFEAKGM